MNRQVHAQATLALVFDLIDDSVEEWDVVSGVRSSFAKSEAIDCPWPGRGGGSTSKKFSILIHHPVSGHKVANASFS